MRPAVSTRRGAGKRAGGAGVRGRVFAPRLIGAAALTIIKICLVPLGSHLFPSPRLRHGKERVTVDDRAATNDYSNTVNHSLMYLPGLASMMEVSWSTALMEFNG
ncbi:unnamed protein product, partial [Brenthis ino]